MNVEARTLPRMRIASLSHRGPYSEIGPTFRRLGEIAGRTGLFQLAGATMVGLYHDDPQHTLASELRSDAGIIVPDDASLPPELHEHVIPSGSYACTTHLGSYETLPQTWKELLGTVLPASGHELRGGASLEIYRNDPHNTPEEKLITEICVPIA
jgi:AraC family transcriptional regulator